MESIILILISLTLGLAIGALVVMVLTGRASRRATEASQQRQAALEKELVGLQALSSGQIQALNDRLTEKQRQVDTEIERNSNLSKLVEDLTGKLAEAQANIRFVQDSLIEKTKEIEALKQVTSAQGLETDGLRQKLAAATEKNLSLQEKLDTQKQQIEDLGKKFNLEFENIANKILETKTQKFTEVNKVNMAGLLEPLGKNLEEFKKTVNEVYDKEAKERFSLGERVKELAQLNQTIGEEARSLTRALKGESKTQGRWGEMILETLLEKSGLRKGEEYFLEHQLTDDEGIALRSDSENKKMRPDAVIRYPDQRTIIVDSKVSLNAFVRYTEAEDLETQKTELKAHVQALRNHIITLSTKGYDDFTETLDFVMMFIPSEPAYMAALQGDPELWSFAYDKRILLINPTNLIISLKLVSDLWKREHQNRNAQDIAERGAKLYDKFVTFAESLIDVGRFIEKSHDAYGKSYKLLTEGNDNLVLQATKLKALGLKTKKDLSLRAGGPTPGLLVDAATPTEEADQA